MESAFVLSPFLLLLGAAACFVSAFIVASLIMGSMRDAELDRLHLETIALRSRLID